jgi:hypothetical protein
MKFGTTLMIIGFLALGLLATGNMPFVGGEKGNGNVTTSDRTVADFHGISVSSGIDLVLTQGSTETCVVSTDENLQEKIITKVKNGVLEIYVNGSLRTTGNLSVAVTFKQLDELSASGGSDIEAKGQIQFTNLEMNSSGGSDIELQIAGTDLEMSASGGSDVLLSGEVKNCEVSISGGSDLKAKKLTMNSCDITVSGGSDAYVYVKDAITLAASGASDVHLSGDPKVSKSLGSSSDLIRD